MAHIRRAPITCGLAAAVVFALLAFTMAPRGQDLALYNHSPSVPVGIYLRAANPSDTGAVKSGAIVTVRARDVAPEMAAARSFAGDSHRFLKRIAALEGDEVCGDGSGVRINGGEAFPLQREASTSLMLQVWTGCRRLMFGEALLLGDTPDSFDGRYWGPIDARLIEGVWRKL